METLDLIIPVYKPDERFYQLMERIEKQTVLPERIILMHTVVAGFDKKLRERYGSRENITIVELTPEEFDHGGTRNRAAAMSRADYIMFMTQDAIPLDKKLIENIKLALGQKGVAAAYGRQICGKEGGVLEGYTRKFNYPEKSRVKSLEDLPTLGIKTYFCSNACAAYNHKIYDELGGFVTKTIFNEDMIFAAGVIKAGYKIAYAADVRVEHTHKYTGWQQLTRNFDLGVSQKQYASVFAGVKSESEGIRLVKDTAKWLIAQGKPYLLWELFWQSSCKFIGYRLGKSYEKLPKWLILKLTMNKKFWKEKR